MNLIELGQLLKDGRETIGIPKAVIARRVGVSDSYVSMVEAGKRRPSKGVLERWIGALSWPETYLASLLVLAGHLRPDTTLTAPRPPALPLALHYKRPKRLEEEDLMKEVRELLDLVEQSDKQWDEVVRLLRVFIQGLTFYVRGSDEHEREFH